MSKFAWIEELFANLGYAERGRRLAQAAASNPGLERAIRAAVDSGDRRQLLELLGQNIRATDPPPVRAQPAPPIDLPVEAVQRAHAAARDNWPLGYDADADEVMQSIGEFSPSEQKVLRELADNDWLGFDYPSQAMDAVLQADGPKRWEMSPGLLAARAELVSPRGRPRTDEQLIRAGVNAELGPVSKAPMPFVRRAHEALIDAGGGEDLVARLYAEAPRPVFEYRLSGEAPNFRVGDAPVSGGAYRPDDVMPGRQAMDPVPATGDAANAMEGLAPRDLGTSLADTGALGPAAQQLFGVPGPVRSRQVGTHGAGQAFGDVIGPRADLSVQIAGPGGVRSDILPGSSVVGDMPVGRPGDVIGPAATDVDILSAGGRATIDDAVGPAGAWEGRINRRGGQVTGEDVVSSGPASTPAATPPSTPTPRISQPAADANAPDTRMATDEELFKVRNAAAQTRNKAARQAPRAPSRADVRRVGAQAAGAGAVALGGYMMQPEAEFPEPPIDVRPSQDLVDDAVGKAVNELTVTDDLNVPEVSFAPLKMDDAAPAQVPLPPVGELLADVPAPAEPMVGEPVGVPRSTVPAHRRLMEIRDLLQRGGDEEAIRNDPRYADLDSYQKERAILRGRDLGDRLARVRMAGILSQGGRLPWGQAAAAGDRFLRMAPEEQQDFLVAGGFGPGARGAAQAVAERQQHRRRLEEIAALGQNQMNAVNAQGEFGVRGAQVAADAQMGVAGLQAGVARDDRASRERQGGDQLAFQREKLRQDMAIANAQVQQAVASGNADRLAAATQERERLRMKERELAASGKQAAEANASRERMARIQNPAALDPLDAVERAAVTNAAPKILELVGKAKTRAAAYASIRNNPVASQAPMSVIKRALDNKFPE